MTINFRGREIEVKKSILVLAVIAAVIIAGGIGFIITGSGRDIIIEAKKEQNVEKAGAAVGEVPQNAEQDTGQKVKQAEKQAAKEDNIKIYIVGCIKKPGVITLKKGQLIDDAVRLAGGLTAEADPDSINMVYELKENVMLHIQSKKEIGKLKDQQNIVGKSGGANGVNEAGKGIKVVKDSGSAQISGKTSGGNSAATSIKDGKVNLNTASAAELDTLPGVGEATAKEIISYREANGPFKKTTDIMKIPRIKESRYGAIKDYITVD